MCGESRSAADAKTFCKDRLEPTLSIFCFVVNVGFDGQVKKLVKTGDSFDHCTCLYKFQVFVALVAARKKGRFWMFLKFVSVRSRFIRLHRCID